MQVEFRAGFVKFSAKRRLTLGHARYRCLVIPMVDHMDRKDRYEYEITSEFSVRVRAGAGATVARGCVGRIAYSVLLQGLSGLGPASGI